MSKKIQLALLALLGFSTACSTVKNGEKTTADPKSDKSELSLPAIRVLYGVRPPKDIEQQIEQQVLEKQKEEAAKEAAAKEAAAKEAAAKEAAAQTPQSQK